ncbi:hypothetical protein JX265_000691 [Neoarthrinium moseri]|uniref:Uncharacterized protein n=1 Tax=Neoarthrinium moseri TaxID=1658444 RepID=A0A9Q0AX56_9PEZI|nr:uncharacterized protein JN550_001560 [Neoarthrinium moseri]KAI1854283.1 hypothetical protein JX266_001424 [Neoarthrinium moseri]KAI1876064.1 hypothetical protein JN550_001560 [Neoarthrinium moseri]KAI1881865.1 hypothetical protein JX265_000691 [Neoarthrinium moseri]
MKTSSIAAVLAPSAASAQWWGGAPECAQSCLSSAYWGSASATTSAYWPAQSEYCASDKGDQVSSCVNAGCASTSTAWASYSSLSSSLCSQWESCTSAGSTGVQTITYPSGSVTWGAPGGWPTGKGGPGNWGGPSGPGGPGGAGGWAGVEGNQVWSEWAAAYSGSKTWSGGVVTVTGCVGNGSPWYAGPNGGWNDHGGFNGWVGWGAGWSQGPTVTTTVTYTTTDAQGSESVYTGLATVAAAVSGDITTTQTLGSQTAGPTATHNAAPGGRAEGSAVTGMMGVALGAVVAVAGML